MDRLQEVVGFINETICGNCDEEKCEKSCYVNTIFENLRAIETQLSNVPSTEGCANCRDRKGKIKSFFVMDDANRTISDVRYCPVCGSSMANI